MKKVAFLSMDYIEGFFSYDDLLFDPLKKFGWEAETISWKNKSVNWKNYDVVIVRSTWDYQKSPNEFLEVLKNISSQTRLENSLEIIKWNMDKIYLKELEEKGINIVSSLWRNKFSENELHSFFEYFNTDEIIIKPNVSVNAFDTFRIRKETLSSQLSILNSTFSSRSFFVQPFMESVITEGEYSLFYFGGKYSHAILKTPKLNDFRVQEEHGGIIKLVDPEDAMKMKAEKLLNVINNDLLYARIDYVRTDENNFALMELELIEPSLYFNMDPESPDRFANIFNDWINA